ncbi:hypothetical protein EJ04DRAFT_420749, partial [Polyplosphaeria fusca]
SSDDELSDPPTDSSQAVIFASPKRRTDVRVVIPSSTGRDGPGEPKASRSLRQRTAIQLHPYLLEGERYRQEWVNRGLRPVQRPQSPPRQPIHEEEETQDQEFDPENDSPPNSLQPPAWSTPSNGRMRSTQKSARLNSGAATESTQRGIQNQRSSGSPSRNIKRRKLKHHLTQFDRPRSSANTSNDSFSLVGIDDKTNNADVWAIPHSPPYSSSPPHTGALTRLWNRTPLPGLPTPLNSSSVRNVHELVDDVGESAVDPEVSGRTPQQRLQLIAISSDSSSTNTESSDEVSSETETEVQRVGRRIKGVLPASWLRLDRQAQEQKETLAKDRELALLSPDITGPQRGVAKKVTKRAPRSRATSARPEPIPIVVYSDESDHGTEHTAGLNRPDSGEAAQAAYKLASNFDRRCAGDDSDNMESDRLHLFRIGSTRKTKPRQSKLPVALQATQKVSKASVTGRGIPRSSTSHVPRTQSRLKRLPSQKTQRTIPRMSIVDFQHSISPGPVPQFIKLAMHAARRQPLQGRESPRRKYVRLHRRDDTQEALSTLNLWRSGSMKPRQYASPPESLQQPRSPLVTRPDNQQDPDVHFPQGSHEAPDEPAQSHSISITSGPRSRESLTQEQLFLRNMMGLSRKQTQERQSGTNPTESEKMRKGRAISQFMNKPDRPLSRPLPSLRLAQLEGLESTFSRGYQKAAFAKSLQRIEHRSSFLGDQYHMFRNPQLARFLADDTAPLPVSLVDGSRESSQTPEIGISFKEKGRTSRKRQARRIDVDTRRYRQPSEPAVQEFDSILLDPTDPREHVLYGLGPFGTKYPITFDVSPLGVGTYFSTGSFIGSEDLRRALDGRSRDMDAFAGYHTIRHKLLVIRCGPWDDETQSQLTGLFNGIWAQLDGIASANVDPETQTKNVLRDTSDVLRSLIAYLSSHLSFIDAIDRREFTSKMKRLLETLRDRLKPLHCVGNSGQTTQPDWSRQSLRPMAYILVLGAQLYHVASHGVVEPTVASELARFTKETGAFLVQYLVRGGISELGTFLDCNKKHKVREDGIQESDVLVNVLVTCLHVLGDARVTGSSFWDLVSSELSNNIPNMVHLNEFEAIWASIFTLLPFAELDITGVLAVNRRSKLRNENWSALRDLLKRLFTLYPRTLPAKNAALNDYIRTSLTRCHVLIDFWHWRKCDSVLNVVFDFFARNGLQQLHSEESRGSPKFLERLAEHPSLALEPTDSAFHIFLKCMGLGLQGMREDYSTKKLRSFVFRCTPNHGRSYPKDQTLDQESLDALRNHHDLMCTLYWASPPSCRPKLDLIRGLVQHETSHRQACRLNVHAWANLAAYQLSTEEPPEFLKPLAAWQKDMLVQTMNQYRLAKVEAEEYAKQAQVAGDSDISRNMVHQTIDKNQLQAIATIRDCIAGMGRAIKYGTEHSVRVFLQESGTIDLLELPRIEDARLTGVIYDTLVMLKKYMCLERADPPEPSQLRQEESEESQDYGDFPDLMDIEGVEEVMKRPIFTFLEAPLWHLLSNAFGAEPTPGDEFLMQSIDVWVMIAGRQVAAHEHNWSHYLGQFSRVSWQQLRDTEQSRKFGPYFMASLIRSDRAAFEQHRHECLTALLVALVEREALLRFQDRLLHALMEAAPTHPLFSNLPFLRDSQTGRLDVSAENLRARRLQLISSILANMRDQFLTSMHQNPESTAGLRREFAEMLESLMKAMKNNYSQLHQGQAISGVYAEFAQQVVQFLQQYAPDICAVDNFFTDPARFPPPLHDPTYVVGRVRRYGPKLSQPGVMRELSIFLQTVAQQAAGNNEQENFGYQLSTALSTSEAASSDARDMRNSLFQHVFPAYIEIAFMSKTSMLIARPILQALKPILHDMFPEVDFAHQAIVWPICNSIKSLLHAFRRSMETIGTDISLLQQPYVLYGITLFLDTMAEILPFLDYFASKDQFAPDKPCIVTYFERLSDYLVPVDGIIWSPHLPIPDQDLGMPFEPSELLSSNMDDLRKSIEAEWSEEHGCVFFRHGRSRKEVLVDFGGKIAQGKQLFNAVQAFREAIHCTYG